MLVTTVAILVLAGFPRDTVVRRTAAPIHPASRVWITGASNIRRFTCTARQVDGVIALRGTPTTDPLLVGENTSLGASVGVTVEALDCGIRAMNRHLRDALRGAQHPRIEFWLATYDVDLRGATVTARIAGTVTVAGVTRPLRTVATLHADSLGALHVVGAVVVRPSDFGVTPPRRFGGLLRVRDRATVHFDIAIDPDGGVVDRIRCAVPRVSFFDLEREPTHAIHS